MYLASREWAILKRLVKERSGGICERCKVAPATQVHHTTYERLGAERLEDLQYLCRPCHEYESAVSAFDPLQPAASALNFNPEKYEEMANTVLEPVSKIADPKARKAAAVHLANALGLPAVLFLERLGLRETSAK